MTDESSCRMLVAAWGPGCAPAVPCGHPFTQDLSFPIHTGPVITCHDFCFGGDGVARGACSMGSAVGGCSRHMLLASKPTPGVKSAEPGLEAQVVCACSHSSSHATFACC